MVRSFLRTVLLAMALMAVGGSWLDPGWSSVAWSARPGERRPGPLPTGMAQIPSAFARSTPLARHPEPASQPGWEPSSAPPDHDELLRRRILQALIRVRLRLSVPGFEANRRPPSLPYAVRLPLVQTGPASLGGQHARGLSPLPTPTPSPTPTPTPTPTPLPEPTPDGVSRTVRVPILMYHYISQPPEDADIYRQDLSVAPELFAQHLDRILAEGYTPITLYDLVRYLTRGVPLPPRPVILTFDDGYRDNYTNAFPRLRERGMVATFFVVTDFIDQGRPEYLTWDMAREMLAAGMSIESHGRDHVDLRERDDDYLVWQALGSLETIQYELGVRPRFVAYPGGAYDADTIRIFHSAGYWAGLTTIQGATHSTDNLFELRRVRVRGSTTPDDLARMLDLDW